ncbi:MAG TPA: universal stress protein [Xanthomonadales bacterium]|nr:universal stress protein [Xanthomonadales bacterium]
MAGYKTVAVAVDLSNESNGIIQRALDVTGKDCTVHLVYVQEPLDSVYMGVVPYGPVFVGMSEVEENLKKELKGRLDALGDQYGIPARCRHFLNGAPAKEIHRFTDENQVELVVLGTHGQKGVQLLLGATANSVLHGSNCDVLAVRIREND